MVAILEAHVQGQGVTRRPPPEGNPCGLQMESSPCVLTWASCVRVLISSSCEDTVTLDQSCPGDLILI
jgi:hypothetical protein